MGRVTCDGGPVIEGQRRVRERASERERKIGKERVVQGIERSLQHGVTVTS